MTNKLSPEKIESMRQQLGVVRKASLEATRHGDFMQVARLTTHAARINKAILDAECELMAA